MAIKNYTTTIPFEKTIGEISKCLVAHGVTKIVTDYEGITPIAITFCTLFNGKMVGFSLPCNYGGVFNAMQRARVPRKLQNKEQALRVSWRIIKDWVEAQMAIVEAGLADVPQVFLPYAITPAGDTLYNRVKTDISNILLIKA